MKVIALLIALFVNSLMPPGGWRSATGFNRYAAWLQQRLMPMGLWDQPLGAAILLLPLLLPVLALQLVFSDALLGFVWIGLSILALCFAFGGGETIETELAHFLMAWRQGDEPAARASLTVLQGGSPSLADDVEFAALPEAAASAMVLRARTRLFSPVFWFMIFGPVGAVAYRFVVLARAFSDGHDNTGPRFCECLARLLGWLDWLPNRLLVLGLALAGHFKWAWSRWETAGSDNEDARLINAAFGAVGSTDDSLEAVEDAHALLRRALYVWVAFAAALVLFGLG